MKLDVKPHVQQHCTFKATLGPKPAGKIEKVCSSALMHTLPHFPWAPNVNEGCRWVINDETTRCKQFLQNQTVHRVSITVFILGQGRSGSIDTALHCWKLSQSRDSQLCYIAKSRKDRGNIVQGINGY